MRYSDEIIEEVRQNNDVVDIISQYVHLTRKGRNYFGLCPFHSEKSPSFSVSPDRQIFHCFGCGVGGNVYTFLMKIEGITFKESLEQLAERANIQLPTYENSNFQERFCCQDRKRSKKAITSIYNEGCFKFNFETAFFFISILRS